MKQDKRIWFGQGLILGLIMWLVIGLIPAVFCSGYAFAAGGDDFNDNSKDPMKWGTDEIKGHGVMTETSQRLEYTCGTGTNNDDVIRPWVLTRFPYNADWEMQLDVGNLTVLSVDGQINSFGIKVRSPHSADNEIYAELYAAHWGAAFTGFHTDLETDDTVVAFADSGSLGVTHGAVRMVFTSTTKVITVFYDIDTSDGYQWVEYGSFGLAGAGGADGNTDWGLTDTDLFPVFLYGYSTSMTITAGQLYGDNFVETGGVATPGPFDALIAELQARSEALSGSTDKVEQKQKKAVDKALATLATPSTSLATNLKTAGKVAKILQKAFPNEFTLLSLDTAAPEMVFSTSLETLFQQILNDFHGDIQALLDDAQAMLDGKPSTSCKIKAQAVLTKAAEKLAAAGGGDAFATLFKTLGKALKDVLKGEKLGASCDGVIV